MDATSETLLPGAVTPQNFGAKGDGAADDTAAFQAAISTAADSTGVVFIPGERTYRIEAGSLTLPDADLELYFGGGACLLRVITPSDLFVVPDRLTEARRYILRNPKAIGGDRADQWFLTVSDSKGRASISIYDPDITRFRNIFNVHAGDTDFNLAHILRVQGGQIVPPGRGTGFLLKTAKTAGSFRFAVSTHLEDCRIYDPTDLTRGFSMDYDGDLYVGGEETSFSGTCRLDGLTCYKSAVLIGTARDGTDSLEVFGRNWDCQEHGSLFLIGLVLKLSNNPETPAKLLGVSLGYGAKIVVNSMNAVLHGVVDRGGGPAPTDCIEILNRANDCSIIGGALSTATETLIRNSGLRTRILGVSLKASGRTKTIADTGPGDYRITIGCTGLSTGGGQVLAAHSRGAVGELNLP